MTEAIYLEVSEKAEASRGWNDIRTKELENIYREVLYGKHFRSIEIK